MTRPFDEIRRRFEEIEAISRKYNVTITMPTHDDFHIDGRKEDCVKAAEELQKLCGASDSKKERLAMLYGHKPSDKFTAEMIYKPPSFGRKREFPMKNIPPPKTEEGEKIKKAFDPRAPFPPIIQFPDMEELELRILESMKVPVEFIGGKVRRPCTGEKKFGFGCPFCEMLLDRYPEDRGEGGIE